MLFAGKNRLEEEFSKAVAGKSADFMSVFMKSPIYLIHHGGAYTPPAPGEKNPALSLSFTFQEGEPCIPVFSSLPRLRAYTRGKSSHYTMKARDFMAWVPGISLCLNPEAEQPIVIAASDSASGDLSLQ